MAVGGHGSRGLTVETEGEAVFRWFGTDFPGTGASAGLATRSTPASVSLLEFA